MNNAIREAVIREIETQGLSRVEVAEMADLTRQYLTDMLKGRKGEVPPSWERLFDALGLELVVTRRGNKHD